MHKCVKFWLTVSALLVLLTISSYYGWKAVNSPFTDKTSYNATLVQAYEYGDRCGYKGRDTCSAWKGRFKESSTGKYFDKDITGFFYQNYVEGGRKDIASYITLNREEFGEKTPWYGDLLGVIFALSLCCGLSFIVVFGITLPWTIEEYELAAARKEYKNATRWERRAELESKWGYRVKYGS